MLLLLMLLVGACSSGPSDDDLSAQTTPTAFVAKPRISLVVNDWTASALNVAVAEQLIERHLGYPVVAERIDDTTEIYDRLADGSLDANLEVWPSNMSPRDQRYLDDGEVADLGELGSVGKVGWFVPDYVVEQHPAVVNWEAFNDPEIAALFASPTSGSRGRLLGTNPDYEQYDKEIIANLNLPLRVEFSGSEEATMAELSARHEAAEPVLVYWWTPTAAVGNFDLVNVALPESNEACQASAEAGDGGVNCDYPENRIIKVASPDLADKAPDVLAFLERFTLTTDDQIQLLVAVETEGATVDAAASAWIEANESTWQSWLGG